MSDTAKKNLKRIEGWMESAIFASRWLLAPFYLGLALSLIVLLIKFLAELGHIAAHAFTATESEVILGVLALVDLALTGSLLVIVIFSGYENFVSRIDHGDHKDWPEWMGKIDFSALKLKLLSSIVAISAIQLLKQFMAIKTVSDRDIMWLVVVHVVFVVSSVLLALSDRIAVHSDSHGPSKGHGNGGQDPEKANNPNPDQAVAPKGATHQANPLQNRPTAPAPAAAPTVPAAAGSHRSNVRVTRVEVKTSKLEPAQRKVAHEFEDLLPGERRPIIKRRLN